MIFLKPSKCRPLVYPMIVTYAKYRLCMTTLLEGNKCSTAGGFPSNPILFGSAPNSH